MTTEHAAACTKIIICNAEAQSAIRQVDLLYPVAESTGNLTMDHPKFQSLVTALAKAAAAGTEARDILRSIAEQ